MKMVKMVSVVLSVAIMGSYTFVVNASDGLPKEGDNFNGFTVTDVRDFELINADLITFEHEKTGATVVYISNDDINRAFDISFRTPPESDNGLTHVFEHSALSGSTKYPSNTLAMKLMSQSYSTFMNASTDQNNTNYMMSSLSEEQLLNLADYYLSGTFDTLIYSDPSIKEREAWHYELESAESDLTLSGTVYSEMQGYQTDFNTASYTNYKKTMYPTSPVAYNQGGDPDYIPELTNDDMIEYHEEYYHPSNSLTLLYGDIEYEKFLSLLDSYFSRYDKKEFDIDLSCKETPDDYIEKTYEFPVAAGEETDKKSSIYYAFECKDMTMEDTISMSVLCSVFNAFVFPAMTAQLLPGTVLSCGLDMSYIYPSVVFMAQNVNPEDKDMVINIVDQAILTTSEISDEFNNTLKAQTRLSTALAAETSNLGVSLAVSAAGMWGTTGDPYTYFDMQDMSLDEENYKISGIANKYLNGRSSVTITVPKAGLLEEKQASLKDKLSGIKSAMTDDEIAEIVKSTAEYKEDAQNANLELDNELIKKINTVSVDDLNETVKKYPISDTTEGGIRYIDTTITKKDIGQGRIMFDVSDFSVEELNYLSLYQKLMGNTDTENYSYNDFMLYASSYANCGTDIMTIGNGDELTPYFIFKWKGFSEYSNEIYDIANEMIFGADMSDPRKMKNTISQMINLTETSMTSNAYLVMVQRAIATSDLSMSYKDYIVGLDFLEFLKDVYNKLEEDPSYVLERLSNVKSKLYNKSGAVVMYAGDEESISRNKAAAQKFFENIPSSEKVKVDYSSLLRPKQSEAYVINSTVNYNGIYMPLDEDKCSGKDSVVSALILEKYLMPQIRNKHNAYGCMLTVDEQGIVSVSYRDPELKATFDEYGGIADFLRNGDITQDELDNYIKNIYSGYIKPNGELSDAYWAVDNYMSGYTPEYIDKMIEEAKSTTVDDVRGYADVFEKWYSEGIKFTAGNGQDIMENIQFYDTVINASDAVTVMVNGEVLKMPIDAYISNDITMVPMRAIFEALGAEVQWDDETRTVTAKKDDITIKLVIDSDIITVIDGTGNTDEIQVESPAVIVDDNTVVPVRAVSESLGCDVGWEEATRTVDINM